MSPRTCSTAAAAFTIVAMLSLPTPIGADAITTRAAAAPGLYVTFQVGGTFSMTLSDGTTVGTSSGAATVIPAGAYQLYLNDTSGSIQQFDLSGPGVTLVTNMTNAEDLAASYVETFQPNSTYTYRDDYHPGTIWTFVTSATSVAATTTSPAAATTTPAASPGSSPTGSIVGSKSRSPAPLRGTLKAVVSSSGSLSLTFDARSVGSLRSGRYRVDVLDRSRASSFLLQKTRSPAIDLSGTRFDGTRSRIVDLSPGQWFFYSTATGRKHFFIVES